jgi:hypothetical protein
MIALHERRYKFELRERRADGSWLPKRAETDFPLDDVMAKHPSPAWSASATRIADLKRGDHVRVELDADTALMLERMR